MRVYNKNRGHLLEWLIPIGLVCYGVWLASVDLDAWIKGHQAMLSYMGAGSMFIAAALFFYDDFEGYVAAVLRAVMGLIALAYTPLIVKLLGGVVARLWSLAMG